MQITFKSLDEFPNTGIKISALDSKNYLMQAQFYKKMFLDAFVATLQCETLSKIDPQNDPDGEKALFICFHHYMKNN